MVTRSIRHARKSTLAQMALFPGYIFVALDLTRDRWRCINSTSGVARLVMVAEKPLPLPRGFAEALITDDLSGDLGIVRETFAENQSVCLKDGPFNDIIGRIRTIDARGRVNILLELMGRTVAVATTVDQLSPATV
jgi:transcriptional antiterminator RfaH